MEKDPAERVLPIPLDRRSDRLALGHGPSHLAEGLLLQLTHPLTREPVLVADLLERALAIVHQTESLAQDVRLDRLERRQKLHHLALRLRRGHLLRHRRTL